MNNSNGAALLARIKSGDLVTIRAIGGGQLTGRAVRHAPDALDRRAGLTRDPWRIATGSHTCAGVNAANLIRVQSC